MRWSDYLVESAEFEMAVKDIQPKMKDLYRVLKKNNFQMKDRDIAIYLSSAFRKKGIRFSEGPTSGPHFSPLIDGAEISKELSINVYYVPGFSKYFKRFVKENKYSDFFDIAKNQFFRGFAEVLVHEYRHKFQFKASKSKAYDQIIKPDEDKWKELYTKDKHELDAFAIQSAVQLLRTGKSNVLNQYQDDWQDNDRKTWQRFLKKVDANVQKLKKMGLEKYIKVV